MVELMPCPFCGGEAETHEVGFPYHYWDVWCNGECFDHFCEKPTEAEAVAAWNARAELGGGNCARCAEDMGRYADSLCDQLKERIAELLRCLENDCHIHASWDGLRKFWYIELTEEGVKLRDAARAERTCELVRCRDCARKDYCCFIYECDYDPNGFCAWGKRIA